MAFELRRYSTAGIAAASAGIIAFSPLALPPPALHLPVPSTTVATRTVDLTAFVNPIAAWGDVLTTTVTDIGKLGQMYAADPFPIVRQVIANQVGYVQEVISIGEQMGNGLLYWANRVPAELQTALQQLAAGQFAAGVDGLYSLALGGVVGVMFPLLQFDIPKKIAQNVTNVIGSISTVGIQLALGALGVAYAGEQAFSNTGQQFVDAVKAGDAATAFSAVINFPATLANAVLNGYGDSKGTSGIFGSYGLVASVIRALKAVADAIKPPAPEASVAATADGAAVATAVTDTAAKALAPATKPSANAALKTGAVDKPSTSPVAAKESVTKEDPKPAASAPSAVDAPEVKPEATAPATKVDTSTPTADPVSTEPAKVETTTKPVHRDGTKTESGAKPSGSTAAESDSGTMPAKAAKQADKAPKASKDAKSGKQAKKASPAHRSDNAG